MQRAANFVRAVVRHAAYGFPTVSEEERQRRLDICQGCEFFRDGICRHSKCGCQMKKKASWALEQCPLGHWDVSPIKTRHLLYHLWPYRQTETWKWNLQHLLKRWDVFNGKKVIAVAVDDRSATLAEVQNHLGRSDVEWIEQPNVAGMREVATWHALWERVATLEPGHATFYAHGKGVRHAPRIGSAVLRWTEVMYEVNLDYLPLVERALQTHAMAGAFRMRGNFLSLGRNGWHYSGTFYWIRNRDFFGTNWQDIDRRWWGTESWPGRHIAHEQSACLFYDEMPRIGFLYGRRNWRDIINQEYQRWKSASQQYRSRTG